MPSTSDAILSQIDCNIDDLQSLESFGKLEAGGKVGEATPLFNRLDMEKTLAEIEASLPEVKKEEEKTIIGLKEIEFDDFAKVELRVAKVIDCEPIKKAKKLLKLTLDDGTKEPRTVASGIAQWYKPEDLIGKSVVIVANLKPRTLCGVESKGMVLAGEITEDDIKVLFVDGMPAGTMLG